MKNPVGWFEIYVQEMERARTFYEGVFDVRLTNLKDTEYEMWAFPMLGDRYGSSGALIHIPGYPSGNNSTVVYFNCVDCLIESEKVLKHGGRIEIAKKSIGQHGYIALAYDTEGNLIGLHSRK